VIAGIACEGLGAEPPPSAPPEQPGVAQVPDPGSVRPLPDVAEAAVIAIEDKATCGPFSLELDKDRYRIAGSAWTEGEIRDHLASLLPPRWADLTVTIRPPLFCRVLDFERDGQPSYGGRPSIAFDRLNPVYREGDTMVVTIDPGDREGYLTVDVFDPPNAVVHMMPLPERGAERVAFRQKVVLGGVGANGGGFRTYTVGPPFGPAMVVAILSDRPLFADARAESEPAASYLRALTGRIAALRLEGARIVLSHAFLETKGQ
jgi:eukaryotic-like serine/threonine-protein kinase